MADTLVPLTELQTVDVMIYETTNQLTKCKVMERAFARMMLTTGDVEQQRAANQNNIRAFEKTLASLEQIRKTVVEEQAAKSA